MKTKQFNILISCLLLMPGITFAASTCSDSLSGPAEVISCAAKDAGYASAADFWNKKLFSPITLDGYCKNYPASQTSESSLAQRDMGSLSCSSQAGSYFSYENFIAADAALKTKLGSNYTFMRNGSYALNLTELANFLATAAQETTGNGILPVKYQQDGLYFRYEVPYINTLYCYTFPANPNYTSVAQRQSGSNCATTSLAQYYTTYYPLSPFVVATNSDYSQVYTAIVVDNDGTYDLSKPAMSVTFWRGKPTLTGGTFASPSGTWQYMNQTLPYGYWIGLGNLQLTGVSMTQFFGWYYQNLAPTSPQNYANFPAFVQQYLGDGTLAWEGGLWYWNFRISGYLQPTLHSILTGSKAACHDIGITTYLVNGGCNDYEQRVEYYKYYKTTVFKLSSTGVPYTYNGVKSNSMECSANIKTYCTSN